MLDNGSARTAPISALQIDGLPINPARGLIMDPIKGRVKRADGCSGGTCRPCELPEPMHLYSAQGLRLRNRLHNAALRVSWILQQINQFFYW